jgi:hypothetical protein
MVLPLPEHLDPFPRRRIYPMQRGGGSGVFQGSGTCLVFGSRRAPVTCPEQYHRTSCNYFSLHVFYLVVQFSLFTLAGKCRRTGTCVQAKSWESTYRFGSPRRRRKGFIAIFCEHHASSHGNTVRRIEFKRLSDLTQIVAQFVRINDPLGSDFLVPI